jgi:hypothetical protein
MVGPAPSGPDRDALVLDSIERLGIGVRELLRSALGGTDPNNILARLMGKGLVRSVPQGLPQNRSYYVPASDKPLGPQALQQRLAVAWYSLMCQGPACFVLKSTEMTELFGLQAPSGTHVFEFGKRPRVLHVYAPETVEVAAGIVRQVERAVSFPRVEKAVEEGSYAFLVLVPWLSGLERALRDALDLRVGDLAGVESRFTTQVKRLRSVANKANFVVERVPAPETLTLALKESLEKAA